MSDHIEKQQIDQVEVHGWFVRVSYLGKGIGRRFFQGGINGCQIFRWNVVLLTKNCVGSIERHFGNISLVFEV